MIRQILDGTWRLREAGAGATPPGDWLPATVPGGVHLDLMTAGRIADPFVGDEELRVQWVAERDWEYGRELEVDAEVAAEERVELVCDGLDTLAEIRLNGEYLGSADNMFRTWRWDVTGRLRPGPNELAVTFRSAVRAAAKLEAQRHLDSANDQLPGAPYLRKAPCHFGWDWGPRLPNAGLWQGVRLEGWSVARLTDVRPSQEIGDGTARLRAHVSIERTDASAGRALNARLRVAKPGGGVEAAGVVVAPGQQAADLSVEIAEPELWWPNGLGSQPLYRVEVELVQPVERPSSVPPAEEGGRAEAGRILDARLFDVGLRSIVLRREPDELGESFEFVVNGVPVFAKGSNWIPADTFPARATPERVTALLEAAAAANHNMVRVWGGGYYETEAFYDACDRLGILVWQDFMFACSVYPLGDGVFVDNVLAEVTEQVRRLRHRACLALWCGNNEMEFGWSHWGWDRPETADLKAAYMRFFGETLPGLIAAEDGTTPYWPSSPSSGRPLVEAIGGGKGDEHQWVVWHGLAPFAAYAREVYRFVSEFGFESLPAAATVSAFAPDPADRDLASAVMAHHQRCPSGNSKILHYLGEQFRLPRDFDGLVYLSQVLQAEAMRVGVEHWRRERASCAGALYWQLDDCWPVTSWSSIDYFGRWKALQYSSRRFFAPVLLSCSVGADAVELVLTNDRAEAWRGEVRWSLERLDGTAVQTGHADIRARGTASSTVGSVRVPAARDARSIVLVTEVFEGERLISRGVTPFVPDKDLALRRPTIETAASSRGPADGRQVEVRLRSDTLARWVELSIEGADVRFSDNYFDLPAGREVAVEFELPEGWEIERARSALRVRSVADTY